MRTAIKSDDPMALAKLRQKLETLESNQQRMKDINAAHRKFLKNPAFLEGNHGLSDEDVERVRNYVPRYSWEPNPFPPYALQNNNANIKRVKGRIAELELTLNAETSETEHEGFTVVENVEMNRIQLLFDSKPDADVRSLLKQNGFRWAPSQGAWQRHLNQRGKNTTDYVVSKLAEM